jgi:hypothetical protein
MSYYNPSPIVRFGRGLGAFFFLLGAPISGYFLMHILLQAKAAEHWPSTVGALSKAQVHQDGVGHYTSEVEYHYRVNNQDFTGTRIKIADGESEYRDAAEQSLRGLKVGQPLDVFYDPADPQQSVLQNGVGFQEYGMLIIPVIMFAIGAGVARHLYTTRASARND